MRLLVIWYFIFINVIGAGMMRNDKRYARQKKRRISEKSLWLAALAGGAPGMTAAMRMYRHKTKHLSFKYGFPLLAAVDLILYGVALYSFA